MIPTASMDAAGIVLPETHSAKSGSDTSDTGFSDIFSSVTSDSTNKTIEKTDTSNTESGPVCSEKTDEDEQTDIDLEQLYQLMEIMGQVVKPEHQEAVASIQETITGVLEGNSASGDTDIATALTELKNCFDQLSSEEKEAILARMPQATTLFQEPDRAVTGNPIQIDSILCPLENFSEQTEVSAINQTQTEEQQTVPEMTGVQTPHPTDNEPMPIHDADSETAVIVGEDESSVSVLREAGKQLAVNNSEAADETVDAAADGKAHAISRKADPADGKVQTTSDVSSEETRGDDTSANVSVEEEKTDVTQTEETGNTSSSQDASEVEATTAMLSADSADTHTDDTIKTAAENALTKLTDILSSYDESGSDQFEIQLEPENLGKLSISLSMGEDGLKALIRTKDAQVQGLLSSEINMLVDKLSENGVQIKSMDVICTDMGGEQFDSQYSGNGFSGQNASSYGGRSSEEMQTAYEEISNTQMYAWADETLLGSTVSYRA